MTTLRTEKPWGYELVLLEAGDKRVKLLHVNPGCRTSLQLHRKKDEQMTGFSGKGYIAIGPEFRNIEPGEILRVPPLTVHRIFGGPAGLEIIEFSVGDDADIVRIDDDYGRV